MFISIVLGERKLQLFDLQQNEGQKAFLQTLSVPQTPFRTNVSRYLTK